MIHIEKEDCPIWTVENSETFTSKSAWQNLRKHKNSSFTASMNWHKNLPFQMSFFMMRMLQNRLPTDEANQKFSSLLPSKCSCCTHHKEETIMHLFCTSEIAKQVWLYFGNYCEIHIRDGDTRQLLMSW